MGRVYVIGMAGGIGAGKSAVAGEFRRLGAEVLDADAMVHEQLKRPATIRRIAARFGRNVLDGEGRIDRAKVARKAFVDEKSIRDLERILHPAVIRRTKKRIAELRRETGQHVAVIDAPLLFEAGMDAMCDAVVYVDVPLKTRQKRVKSTRGWGPAELTRRQKRQESLHYKRRNADFVIRNGLSRRRTAEQVRTLWKTIQAQLQTPGPA